MSERKFIVKAFGKSFYCKITSNYGFHSFVFGGKNTYCIAISSNDRDPSKGKITHIEYNDACVKDGSLEHKDGTVHMVKAALMAYKTQFPNVSLLTFMDDSHIDCIAGSKQYKLSLAYDYIVKYNKTWYESHFMAHLDENHMQEYKNSLKVLDEPLPPFKGIQTTAPLLPNSVKRIYDMSTTPRDFIKNIRNTYKDKYCFEAGRWLSQYMDEIGVRMFKDAWRIKSNDIHITPDFSMETTSNVIRGGSRTTTRKIRNFSLRSNKTISILGSYQ